MKNTMQKFYIALWVMMLGALGAYYLFFAPRQSEYSPTENRELSGFPQVTAESLFSGQFGQLVETYLLDRFPGRDAVITGVNIFESGISMASHDDYLQIAEDVVDPLDIQLDSGNVDALLSEFETPSAEEKPETPVTQGAEEEAPPVTDSTEEPEITEPEAAEPEVTENPPIVPKPVMTLEDFPNTLGVYMDRGQGEKALVKYTRSSVAAATAVLNKYAALLPENGKLMFTVGPPSYQIYRYFNADQKVSYYSTWDDVINGLGSDNVYAFDATEVFAPHLAAGEYISFRTDNHWTPYGAYLMYCLMAGQAGKELCSYPDDFDITVETPFRGTYFRDDPSAYWGVEPDTLELLMPKFPVEYRRITGPDEYEVVPFLDFDARSNDRYTVYFGGPDGPWHYIQCDNGQAENCLVITDSFGLTVMPYLSYNYGQVHYYDARYYNYDTVGYTVAEMIEKYNIQDIYVIIADFHSFDSGFLITNVNKHLHNE